MRVFIIVKLLLISFFVFSSTSLIANTTNFSIKSAEIQQIGKGFVLNANIDYPLTPRVIEAMDNGVAIVFMQQIELRQPMPLIGDYFDWHDTLWSNKIRYEIRYHALTDQFVLLNLETHYQRTFPSLDSALHEMGKISALPIPPQFLDNTHTLTLRIKTGLDLHALPTPMRPGAMISSKWQLDSPWVDITWP